MGICTGRQEETRHGSRLELRLRKGIYLWVLLPQNEMSPGFVLYDLSPADLRGICQV